MRIEKSTAPDRKTTIVIARATGGYSFKQIADHFRIRFKTVEIVVRGSS
jgi:DNA-directed RNA polymerase specialized sigma24 family protein